MFGIFVILVCAISASTAGLAKASITVVPEQQVQASHADYDVAGYEGGYEDAGAGGQKGGNGAELTSLAHSSAVQAKNAVRSQHTAGSQAAFGVKSSLASAAFGAAQTAQAALVGKQAIVQNLKRQAIDAQQQLQGEISQYHQLEAVAQASQQVSQDAQNQLHTLTAALTAAQGGAAHAEQAAAEAANAAAAQHEMVVEAKQRIAQVLNQLQHALDDLQQTEASAAKAAEAAHVAQSNAAAAGLAVAAASAKSGHDGYDKSINSSHFLRAVNKNEIINVISTLAPGPDSITVKIIKRFHTCFIGPLVHIINLSFKDGVIPSQWKQAVATPIFKAGKKDLPYNYLPISVINNFAKIFEKCRNYGIPR
ncbi:unnamed protein product [Phaedon cochleariae]|uniref:Uncharacterized protein n=1 Tax=Phaedon cochleariae TaxID=80249 RepID=A0A9P0DV30_PHACE|nr:unnamed protein product [Phaedon cochleariae]